MAEPEDLPAGEFSSWLSGMRIAQMRHLEAEVPCGECNACCRLSHFIHIRPEETETLVHIPEPLRFEAPGLPRGNVVMGYDERGRCPMLCEGACSIYAHRPLTCRGYDCRVFAAAGIAADRAEITQRARRWVFSLPTENDRIQLAAVQAAARFLQEHADCFPGGVVPTNPAHVAILAINVYDVFMKLGGESGEAGRVGADSEIARSVMEAAARFADSVSSEVVLESPTTKKLSG